MDSVLGVFIDGYKDVSFEYGVFDCIQFSADWIQLITGVNYRFRFQGHYSSAKEAQELLNQYGFESTIELIDSLFDRVQKRKAKRGCLVSTKGNDGTDAIGVFDGENGLFLMDQGLNIVHRNKLDNYWNIT